MRMFIQGEWVDRSETIVVLNPFDGRAVDTVPQASSSDIEAVLAGAVRGAEIMRNMPAYTRYQLLRKAADLMFERQDVGECVNPGKRFTGCPCRRR